MEFCSRFGPSQTYQNLIVYFFLRVDVSNKSKSKLSEKRELLSLSWNVSSFQSIGDLINK